MARSLAALCAAVVASVALADDVRGGGRGGGGARLALGAPTHNPPPPTPSTPLPQPVPDRWLGTWRGNYVQSFALANPAVPNR